MTDDLVARARQLIDTNRRDAYPLTRPIAEVCAELCDEVERLRELDLSPTGNLTALLKQCWEIAERKGWHDPERATSLVERLCLVHSEISEALEAYRDPEHDPADIWTDDYTGKPEGVAVELADAVIRIFDLAEHHGLNLEHALTLKMLYNESRLFRHGGKRI